MARQQSYNGENSSSQEPETGLVSSVPLASKQSVPPNSALRQVDPTIPLNQPQDWVNTRTGERVNGQLSSDSSQVITGFSRGNSQNTTSYDISTGQKKEADPHPMLDALKNTALIWAGPELGGIAAGAWGAGAAGAGGAGGIAPQIAQTAEFPALAEGTVGATGALPAGLAGGASLAAPASAGVGTGVSAATGATSAAADAGVSGGGILSKVLGHAGDIGNVASKIAAGAAEGRNKEALLNLNATEAAQQGQLGATNADIAQRQYLLQLKRQAISDALRGGLLQGTKDFAFKSSPAVAAKLGAAAGGSTGGLRPSAITGAADIGKTLQGSGMDELSNPTRPGGIVAAGQSAPTLPPGAKSLPAIYLQNFSNLVNPPGAGSKLLNALGMAGSLYGAWRG